ncbi:MAG TPA: hypothetical protein VHV08_11290 [Pirellulales bacterium]|nr:hypothetical protein [Pirellulales bacterium]
MAKLGEKNRTMWCPRCGQDVPGISSPGSGGICCARCGAAHGRAEDRTDEAAATLAGAASHGLDLHEVRSTRLHPSFEDWSVDQSFQQLQARLGMGHRGKRRLRRSPSRESAAPQWQVHGSHKKPSAPHQRPTRKMASKIFGSAVLCLGLTVIAYGAVLMGLSFVDDRPDLWTEGMPLIAVGQVVLLLGLVLKLERVWQQSRDAAHKLEKVDSHLRRLERATAMLGITHGSASQAFYAHMADEANPKMLLADLKGQIDLLAMSMDKRA